MSTGNYKSKVISLSPVTMFAQALIGTLSTSAGKQIGITGDITQLKNPSRTAMLLDEIRFRIYTASVQAPPPNSVLGVIGVRLDLGRMQLTAGRYLPLGLLCAPLDSASELAVTGGVIGVNRLTSVLTWRLPKPLYIPGGETIVPSFTVLGFGSTYNTQPISVDITYVGRSLPAEAALPTAVDVPFASLWQDIPRAGGTDVLAVRSIRSDLKNPFAEPLMVHRVLGLALYKATGVDTVASGYSGFVGSGASFGVIDQFIGDYVPTRMFKSDGSKVVRDATPFGFLFPPTTRNYEVHAVLKRNEFLQLQCDILASNLNAAGATVQMMASIVGSRRVEYAQVQGYGYQEAT